MTENEAIKHGYHLYEKWVSGDKKVDLARVAAVIKQERKYREVNLNITKGLLAEIRYEQRIVGEIRNKYPDLFNRTGCYNAQG